MSASFFEKSQRISHIVDGAAGGKSDIIKRLENEQGEAPDASEKEEK